MSSEIHLGDIGTIFEYVVKNQAGAVENLSAADEVTLIWQKPSKVRVSLTPTKPNGGADGLIRYTTLAGDLDEAGDWRVQVYVSVDGGEWHTDIGTFRVHNNL